jgi:hypothetical protein
VGVYRFTQTTVHDQAVLAQEEAATMHPVKVQTKHVPLVSTSAK